MEVQGIAGYQTQQGLHLLNYYVWKLQVSLTCHLLILSQPSSLFLSNITLVPLENVLENIIYSYQTTPHHKKIELNENELIY